MFQLNFTLNQHTPIIHFQHEQTGATLRATEVKPKLDKFLIRKFEEEELDYSDWLISGQKGALNYKLKFSAVGNSTKISIEDDQGRKRPQQFPTFFANMGDKNSDSEKWFLWQDQIDVRIATLVPELMDIFCANDKAVISSFFATTNFGTRQSKGFGSYCLRGKEPEVGAFFDYNFTIDPQIVRLPHYVRFQGAEHGLQYQTWFKVFYVIQLLHSSIRSGLNIGGLYFKSLMFVYARNKGIQWDKKSIKQKFLKFSNVYKDAERKYTDPNEPFGYAANEKRLMRDMLGLSTDESWLAYRDQIKKTGTIQYPNEKSPESIGRFKSPVRYKVLEMQGGRYQVCVGLEKIPDAFFSAPFSITSRNAGDKQILILKTPSLNKHQGLLGEFDLKEFLDFCFTKCFVSNGEFSHQLFDEHTDESNSAEAKILRNIYQQLSN